MRKNKKINNNNKKIPHTEKGKTAKRKKEKCVYITEENTQKLP